MRSDLPGLAAMTPARYFAQRLVEAGGEASVGSVEVAADPLKRGTRPSGWKIRSR